MHSILLVAHIGRGLKKNKLYLYYLLTRDSSNIILEDDTMLVEC